MQAKYLTESLASDERLVYATRPHWIVFSSAVLILLVVFFIWDTDFFDVVGLTLNFWKGYTFQSLFNMGIGFVGLFALLRAIIFYFTSEYGVTNKRVVIKTGWIQRQTFEIFLSRIEGVNVQQSILGRILGYGTITVIGTGGTMDAYANIPNPVYFHRMIQQQMMVASG